MFSARFMSLALIEASAKRKSVAHDAFLAFTFLFIPNDAFLIHERFGRFDAAFYAIYGVLFASRSRGGFG